MAEFEKSVHEVMIRGSVEDVWRELTKTHEVQGAMFNMRLESSLEVGAKMFMRSKDGKYTGVAGEVLEFDPPKRYAHTFQFTNYDDPPCVVSYDLEQIGDEVKFTLTSDRMKPGTKSTKQMKQGGDMIVKSLKSIVETGKLPFGVRMLYVVFALTAPLTPKRCRSEHWQ